MLFDLAVENGGEALFGIEEKNVFAALKEVYEIAISLEEQERFFKAESAEEKLQILKQYCLASLNLEGEEHAE